MGNARGVGLWLTLVPLPPAFSAAGHPPPTKIQVAEGVFVFRTEPYGDVGLDGNSIVILSPDGAVVFDANGTPAAAGIPGGLQALKSGSRGTSRAPIRRSTCTWSIGACIESTKSWTAR